ncbi:MAG: hypothetical protein ACRD3J_27290 [Thermoanaerobaculia bacterium]
MLEVMAYGLLKIFLYTGGLLALFVTACSLMFGHGADGKFCGKVIAGAIKEAAEAVTSTSRDVGFICVEHVNPHYRRLVRGLIQTALTATIIGGVLYIAGTSLPPH